MRKSFMFILLVICTAIGIVSCNKDDGIKTLSPEEKAAALKQLVGNYTGSMVFYQEKDKDKQNNPENIVLDTINNINWSVNNSGELVIESLPTKPISEFILDKDLKEALQHANPQPLKCKTNIFKTDPIQFFFSENPYQTYNLNYGGKEHTFVVSFSINPIYSWGFFDYKEPKYFFTRLITGSMFLDKEPYYNVKSSNVIVICNDIKRKYQF